MLAAIFREQNSIEIEEVATPEISEDDMLVKVEACAICGTDLRILTGQKTKGVRIPSIIGHEIAGIVAQIGNEVKGFQVGEHVSIAPVLPCRSCTYCKNGKENACLNRKGLGYELDGGFAEYLRVPGKYIESGNVFKIPQWLSFEEACLAEPLGCVYNGSERADITVNDTVVILGAGPIGLMHLMLANIKGATNIFVSEPMGHRRRLAERIGADHIIDPQRNDLHELLLDSTDGLGADVVILSVGIAELADSALRLVKKGGVLNLFGGFPRESKAVIDLNLIHYNEVWVTGTTACTRTHYQKALELMKTRKVDLRPIISHIYPLQEIKEAFDIVSKKSGVKVVVKP